MTDTIVAISSAPGAGQRGIVRLSGGEATAIAGQLVVDESDQEPSRWLTASCRRGAVMVDGDCSFPCRLYVYRGPGSYTGQDLVEIHTIGSPPLLEFVVDRAIKLGARQATPGEFTARAFLNGRMDLARAEAVAELIKAESDGQLRAAQALMRGDLSQEVSMWQAELAGLTALVEAEIDFAEEPIEFISPSELNRRLCALREAMNNLLERSVWSALSESLPHILLLGPPNAGKSTLLNALSGVDRAICSPVAGTTRDLLSAPVRLGDQEALLLDAAGIDSDETQAMMREAGAQALNRAKSVDALCVVLDLTADPLIPSGDWMKSSSAAPTVVVLNKLDRVSPDRVKAALAEAVQLEFGSTCAVSARTRDGLEQLKVLLENAIRLGSTAADTASIHITLRQRNALRLAGQAITNTMAPEGGPGGMLDRADLLAFELREALDALGSITGAVTTEELLSAVFANFCIGK